jgi:hypothetical protein
MLTTEGTEVFDKGVAAAETTSAIFDTRMLVSVLKFTQMRASVLVSFKLMKALYEYPFIFASVFSVFSVCSEVKK